MGKLYKQVGPGGKITFTNVPTRTAKPTTTTTKRPTSTTTTKPRSSYQVPSKTKPSSGVAQPKTAPIKGTPKVPTTTTTKPRALIKDVKKARGAAQERQSMLDEIMKGL